MKPLDLLIGVLLAALVLRLAARRRARPAGPLDLGPAADLPITIIAPPLVIPAVRL